tara:strand:+ start:727 stop:1275 length:549 start_codon:yes stop_codon:yes gene_type:complete
MSKVAITGNASGAGVFTIASPNSATDRTLTLPDATGTLQIGGPAFSAYKTSTQSISTGVATKVTFDTEEFDTNSCFASSTFTPPVAGYYQINGTCYLTVGSGTSGSYFSQIYKNGVALKQGGFSSSAAGENQSSVNSIIYFNGSTDYIEIYARVVGTTPSIYGDANGRLYTYFNGAMVRSAT